MATTDSNPAHAKSNKIYLAMMLLAFFAGPTGLARLYRGDRNQGWSRFWAFIGSLVLTLMGIVFIPFLVLALLVLMSLITWGIIDFFFLYGTKTDTGSKLLVTTDYDKKIAKILLIVFIVLQSLGIIVSIIGFLILTVVFLRGMTSRAFQYGDDTPMYSSSNSSELFSASDAASIKAGMTKAQVQSTLHVADGNCMGDTTYEFCIYHSSSDLNTSNNVYVTYQNNIVYRANSD